MALLDEQIIEEWLNSNSYFTLRGLKVGIKEIDLLAVKGSGGKAEYLHVEVQTSFNPVGYAFGNSNARRRTDLELKEGAQHYYQNKFTHPRVIEKRNNILPNVDWQYVFVHAVLREPKELDHLKQLGVKIISYKNVLSELLTNSNLHRTSSVASNILHIVEYANREDSRL